MGNLILTLGVRLMDILAMGKSDKQLSDRQLRFVQLMAAPNGLTTHKAAEEAGFPNGVYGYQLLRKQYIADAIAAAKKEFKAQAISEGLKPLRVLTEEQRIAYIDPIEFFDPETHRPRHMEELSEDARRAIKSFKVRVYPDGSTEYSYKLWNKGASIERLSRHLGLYERDNQQKAKPVLLQVNIGSTLKDKPDPIPVGPDSG